MNDLVPDRASEDSLNHSVLIYPHPPCRTPSPQVHKLNLLRDQIINNSWISQG